MDLVRSTEANRNHTSMPVIIKKGVYRNGKVIKQGRNACMCMMFSQCNTCSKVIQVEKTLETKKWSRNGKVIKQGRNVYDVLTM